MTPDAQRNIAAGLRRRARTLHDEADALVALAVDFENSAALLEQKSAVPERACPNCDTAMPDGCKGTFKDEGPACRHNWWHLKPFGYAPSKYTLKCPHCKTHVFNVDKRARACMPCATALYESKQREAAETSAPKHKPDCVKENARLDGADRWYMLTCTCGAEVPAAETSDEHYEGSSPLWVRDGEVSDEHCRLPINHSGPCDYR